MFHVYGVGGRLASGGAESMPVPPVHRVERLDQTRDFMVDEQPDGATPPTPQPRNTLAREAVSAYADATHGPSLRTPRITLVEAVMSRDVSSVQDTATLAEAAQWMSRQKVGQTPVLDPQGHIVGMIGLAELFAPPVEPQALVSSRMVSPVPATTPDTDIRLVARVLVDSNLPGLPVVDAEGALCGFVSRGDLLKVFAEEAALDAWI